MSPIEDINDNSSIDGEDDDEDEGGEVGHIRPEVISAAPPAAVSPLNGSNAPNTPSANRHYIVPKKGRRNRERDADLQAYPGWECPPELVRGPYHEYVHSLVEGGWDMMRDLEEYLRTDVEDAGLAISILDIAADGGSSHRWPDLHDESDLAVFLEQNRERERGSVRMYLTEQRGNLAAGVIEALGAGLDLDPRFFQWSLVGHKHVLSPSHRHNAPYITIGYGVPKPETPNRTDCERFNITIYVKPDLEGPGWTGKSCCN